MYQVIVSVKDDQFSGSFTFPTLEKAVEKVFNNIKTGKSRHGISENFLIHSGADSKVTLYCEDEHLSCCSIEYIFGA